MEKPEDKEAISSFQALMVSTASRVGTGNIVGVSSAICIGGFGSVFWMWVIAIIGGILAVLTGWCLLGGGSRIVKVTSMFVRIFEEAFDFRAIFGAFSGLAMMQGIRRELYSNEAGIGSAPNASASANVSHPVKQGLVQMLSVFIDTLLLCTATAMMCMSSGIDPAKELQGAPWVQASLQESLGSLGPVFITVAMVFFAFTTLLGNCFYCDNLLIYIHKKQPEKAFMKGFRLVSALAIFLGAGMKMSLLWDLSDALMGLWHSLTFRLS